MEMNNKFGETPDFSRPKPMMPEEMKIAENKEDVLSSARAGREMLLRGALEDPNISSEARAKFSKLLLLISSRKTPEQEQGH